MGRPETWTAAALVVIGVGVALWLAAFRPPATPVPPGDPEVTVVAFGLNDATRADTYSSIITDPAAGLGVDGLACGPNLKATSVEDGWFRLVLLAPCRPNEPVSIAHGPLVFDALLDAKGLYLTQLPIQAVETLVVAHFPTGDRVEAEAPAGDPPLFAGLSWHGPAVLRLVVDEYGRRLSDRGQGVGPLKRYGGGGQQAAIYAAPDVTPLGRIGIAVDVRGGKACGSDLALTAFDTIAGTIVTRDVTITLPDCGAAPARFVLDNILDDLGGFGERG